MKPLNKNEHFVDQVFDTLSKMADKPAVPTVRQIEINLEQELIDFDELHSCEEVWTENFPLNPLDPSSGFSIVFMNGCLHLTYDEPRDGFEVAAELEDEQIDEILSLLIQYKNWKQRKK